MLTFTKSMLALSVMAAVAGANAATYTEDTTLTDKIFTEGIMAINGATVTVTGDEIAGKWFKATNYSQDVGSKYSSQNLGFWSCRRRRKTADLLVAQANPGYSRG